MGDSELCQGNYTVITVPLSDSAFEEQMEWKPKYAENIHSRMLLYAGPKGLTSHYDA
jgi:hypothetical protein